jgi:hypothetical protein
VIILPDADKDGREGAERTFRILKQQGIEAQIKDLFPQQADHRDLADHLIDQLQQGYTKTKQVVLPARSLPLAHPLPTRR